MTTGAVIFMILCLGGYLLSFAFCTSKALRSDR